MWDEIIKFLGVSAFIIAAITWLSKKIVVHVLSKDIEKYKVQLKAESDMEIEKLRSSLQREAFEHDIRFSKLHDKRADIIAKLYSKMVEMINAATSFVNQVEWIGEPSKKEKWVTARKKIILFIKYFDENQIFLNEEMCDQIKDLIGKIRRPTQEFYIYVEEQEQTGSPVHGRIAAWMKVWELIAETDVPEARKVLENEFRNILGVLDGTAE